MYVSYHHHIGLKDAHVMTCDRLPVDSPSEAQDMIDWVEVLHPVMHASSYMRWPCKGHRLGSSLLFLRSKPNTRGD